MSARRGSTPRRLAVCALCWSAVAMAAAAEHRVVIDRMSFTPQVVRVQPGDTITWVNKDLFVHNVTGAAGLRSGDLQPGQSWRYTVRPGAPVDYICSLHPTMTGRIDTMAVNKAATAAATARTRAGGKSDVMTQQ